MPRRRDERFGLEEAGRLVGVGRTGSRSARIWVRSDRPGKHVLRVWPYRVATQTQTVEFAVPDAGNDGTWSILFPDDFAGTTPLVPQRRYQFQVLTGTGQDVLGSGGFETSPEKDEETPERFSVAVMSCHQPFDETSGDLCDASMRMLRLARATLLQHDTKFVLLCGDQIYADHPTRCSLFDPHYTGTKLLYGSSHILKWPARTVRKAYQQRYRQFWWMDEVQYILAQFPCYPILDDHEILDDWGSSPIHTKPNGGVDYRNLRTGALQAYMDYQASRVSPPAPDIPPSFHYSFDWGTVGVFVMDLRSQRSANENRLYGEDQYRDLERFLKDSQSKHLLLVVTSVPVVHLPDWLTIVGASVAGSKVDFPDHWSSERNQPARDRFLRLLYGHGKTHPKQRIVLVSGDVHVGCAFAIRWKGPGEPTIYQFTSSAISNKMKRPETQASELGPRLFGLSSSLRIGGAVPEAEVTLLPAKVGSRRNNPFGGLNLGIVEVVKQNAESTISLKLLGYTEQDQSAAVEMFASERL